MPPLASRRIGLALDVAGCPNRCRHCWLTCPPNRRMEEATIREVVGRFKQYVAPGEERPHFGRIHVMTWYREPDFHPDYRRLRELELELSDRPLTNDLEVLSIWRLAREPGYAAWGREHRGTRVCQVTFFGTGRTHDWFFRRKGAFEDALRATEALLEGGIRPRWQLFLTKRMVPHLTEWGPLVERLRLRERCAEVGGEFTIFLNAPSPEGEAFRIEHLRPTEADLAAVPEWLLESTRRHMQTETPFGEREGALVRKVLGGELTMKPYEPPLLWLSISPDLDVYPTHAETSRWWRLGSLRDNSVRDIIEAFEGDTVPGLYAMHRLPPQELAARFGRRSGRRLYQPVDLHARWVGEWLRAEHPLDVGTARRRE